MKSDDLLYTGFGRCVERLDSGIAHIVEHHGRAIVGALIAEGHIADMQASDMAGIESRRLVSIRQT